MKLLGVRTLQLGKPKNSIYELLNMSHVKLTIFTVPYCRVGFFHPQMSILKCESFFPQTRENSMFRSSSVPILISKPRFSRTGKTSSPKVEIAFSMSLLWKPAASISSNSFLFLSAVRFLSCLKAKTNTFYAGTFVKTHSSKIAFAARVLLRAFEFSAT